jgi:quinohemoprotein ethanol dehydrogenase
MSTAGNLVVQGRGDGELWVYAADSGKVLKTIQTGSHIMAAPMTYAVDGVQYVAVQVGYGTGIGVGAIPSKGRRPEAEGPQGQAFPAAAGKCV